MTTEDPVQAQLDAYNARDIDAFMAAWAADARYHAFPDRLLAEGAAAIRQRHVERFREPDLHGRLVARMTVGDVVVDQEVVTRNFPEGVGEVDVLAIYRLAGGKIAQAWFKMGAPRLHHAPLRRATAADAAAVRTLTRAAYARWVPLIGREPRPMGADHAQAVLDHRIDLLERDGALLGLIELIPAADHLLIENIAVAPAHQGQGHGRRLLAHAERVAAAMGHGEIRLYTNRAFAANVQLYLNAGYAIDREEPYPAGGVTVFMHKRLPGTSAA